MRFVDDEFLLLSRTGRFSPGTNGRLGLARTREERAQQQLASQRGRGKPVLIPRIRTAYQRARSQTASHTGGIGRRQYGSER